MSIDYAAGNYRGRVVDQRLDRARVGTPRVVLVFEIFGARLRPSRRRVYLHWTHRSLWRTLDALNRLEPSIEHLEYLDPASPKYVDLTGRQCDLVCEHEMYLGELRERWSIV